MTIENVQMSGSGGYTCRAKNSGGLSQANVTLVYSESVATYLDNRLVSIATGIVFVLIPGLATNSIFFCFLFVKTH